MPNVSRGGITPEQITNPDVSIVTIMNYFLGKKAGSLQEIASFMADLLKKSNDSIKELSDLLVKAQDDKVNTVDLDDAGRHNEYEPILKKYGHVPNEKLFVYDSGDYWDANIAYIQSLLDRATATASRQSTSLQNITNTYNNAIEASKSFLVNHNDNARAIISSI